LDNDKVLILGITSVIIVALIVVTIMVTTNIKNITQRAVGCANASETAQELYICRGGYNEDLVAAIEASK